jgi:hypothetical protein
MRRNIIGAGVLLIWWAAVPGAQQQPAAPEPAHKVYILAGCLEVGTTPPAGFRLTGGSAVGEAPPVRTPPPSTPGTAGVYLLQPVSGVGEQGISREQLQSHVGARVEVTVRPVELLRSAPQASSVDSADSKGKPEEPAPRYSAIKISRIADSC